jgi:cytochrome c peroxidase
MIKKELIVCDRRRIPRLFWILSVVLVPAAMGIAGCSAPKEKEEVPRPATGPTPYQLEYPLGLVSESAVMPQDNPLTAEKLELGKRLYFEKNLSVDRTISCASVSHS